MTERVWEDGESECPAVMAGIGVQDLPRRESVPTSIWCNSRQAFAWTKSIQSPRREQFSLRGKLCPRRAFRTRYSNESNRSTSRFCVLARPDGLGCHRLATSSTEREAHAGSLNEGDTGRQLAQGESPATVADPLVLRESAGGTTSDRKSRQVLRGRRPATLGDADAVHSLGSTVVKPVSA